MMHTLLTSALLAWAVAALPAAPAARESFWKDEHGRPTPDTSFRKSVNGFGAWLVVTSDQDWEQKWNTPADTTPHFTEARSVAKGGRIFVLLLFANPAATEAGQVDVACDLEVMRPDKTFSMQQRDTVCFEGSLGGPAHNLYLSAPVISFVGEEADPVGDWIVRVNMKDKVRRVNVPLETSFTLR